MCDRPVRPVEEDRSHRADDHLVGGQVAVVEAIRDAAGREPATGLDERRDPPADGRGLVAGQAAWPIHHHQVVVGEQSGQQRRQPVHRGSDRAGRHHLAGLAGEHTLDLGQPRHRRGPDDRLAVELPRAPDRPHAR